MSSDNYHAVRQDPTDGLWYLYHGFASNLEDGFPATSKRSEGYATEADVLAFYAAQPQNFMDNYYSEYGLLDEGSEEDQRALRATFFGRWPEDLAQDWAEPYRDEFLAVAAASRAESEASSVQSRNEHGWSMVLTQGDRSIEYRWAMQYYQGEPVEYLAQLFDARTGELFDHNESSEADALSARVIAAVTTFRRSEVRSEAQMPPYWEFLQNSEALDATVLQLFERSLTGEYLGQRSGNQYLFVQDLVEILAVPLKDALESAQRLEDRKLLTMEGMVLMEREEVDEDSADEPSDEDKSSQS